MKHSLLQSTKPNETVGALDSIALCLQYYILFYVQTSKAEKSPGELYTKNRHTLVTDEMTQRLGFALIHSSKGDGSLLYLFSFMYA